LKRNSKFSNEITKKILKIIQKGNQSKNEENEIKKSKFVFLFKFADSNIFNLVRDFIFECLMDRKEKRNQSFLW